MVYNHCNEKMGEGEWQRVDSQVAPTGEGRKQIKRERMHDDGAGI